MGKSKSVFTFFFLLKIVKQWGKEVDFLRESAFCGLVPYNLDRACIASVFRTGKSDERSIQSLKIWRSGDNIAIRKNCLTFCHLTCFFCTKILDHTQQRPYSHSWLKAYCRNMPRKSLIKKRRSREAILPYVGPGTLMHLPLQIHIFISRGCWTLLPPICFCF